jgi:hypothetical protein
MSHSDGIVALNGQPIPEAPPDAPVTLHHNPSVRHAPIISNTARVPSDSVTLSAVARGKLLNQEGFSVSEIAQLLGIPVSVVENNLALAIVGLQTKTTTANVAAANRQLPGL